MHSRALRRFENAGRLFLLIGAAVLVTLALTQYSTAETLFQSPVSPLPPQPIEVVPQPQPAPSPTPAPVEIAPPPPEVPLESQTVEEPVPIEPVPIEPVPIEPVPIEPVPAEPPLVDPTLEEFSPQAPTEEPLAEPADSASELRPVRLDRSDTATDDDQPELVLNEAQMVDTFIIYGAWVWLCCGVMVFLLIPLAFLFLQIRGRSQILKEEAL